VRDPRLPPVHNNASTDASVQHGEAFTPARSYADYTIDIALQALTGVRPGPRVEAEADHAGQRTGRLPEGRRLLLLGAHFRRDSLSPHLDLVDVGYRAAADSSLQANEQGTGAWSDGTFPSGPA